jgi:hypothetical protein
MLITVLTSTVLAAIIAALVSLLTTERRIAVENVTQERAKWRARVREMADETQNAIVDADEPKLRQLRSKFALVVNPHDSDDRGILNAISLTATVANTRQQDSQEFIDRVALLLKHDWERGKYESGLWQRLLRSRVLDTRNLA